MPFSAYTFQISTHSGRIRVCLSGDAFQFLCRDGQQSEDEIIDSNMPLLEEITADLIEFGGFGRGIVFITAADIESWAQSHARKAAQE